MEIVSRKRTSGQSKTRTDMENSRTGNNVAELREALEILYEQIWEWFMQNKITLNECKKNRDIIRKALAARARNCDIPRRGLSEYQRYYIEHGCENGLGMVVDGEIKKAPWKSNFEKWLLSEAK